MRHQIEQVLDGLLPHLLSLGVDATLDEVSGQVVCLRLERFDLDPAEDLHRLRRALTREILHRIPQVSEVLYVGELATQGEPRGALSDDDLATRVSALLKDEINPSIASHGGYIDLVKVEGTEVTLQMGGGCQGCAASALTLRARVGRTLREALPEITVLHDITDHGAGVSPYYPSDDSQP